MVHRLELIAHYSKLAKRSSQIKTLIDAYNPDKYFRIRGLDKFKEIIELINTLNDLRAKAGVTKLVFVVGRR